MRSGFRLQSTSAAWLAIAALVTLSKVGCSSSEKKPGELGFRVGFACESDRDRSDSLRLRVLPGSCAGTGEALYEATLSHGDSAPPVDTLAPGHYGVEATAYAQEAIVAHTCIDVSLPSGAALELTLRSDDCDAPPPMDGGAELDAQLLDSGDAELDASDAGQLHSDAPDMQEAGEAGGEIMEAGEDAATDALPLTCATDCSDSDPCTDDVCVQGSCTNPPFTGSRECDGIACTQGDMCADGECQPGAPNDAACADDGNPCTAETCVAGAGCNRSNAGANGHSCNDGIGCTSPDTCNNGICTGVDTCVGSQVCSASSHTCIACTSAQDCDDQNPCTTDACGGGQCSHTNNSANCDDGKSCTSGDVCSGGSCAGTSTCASNASCGGSTCTCNSASDTLCTSKCVNLNTATTDCGLCGRACGSGQSCQNGGCKPSAATSCTAYRSSGHDYLVCTDLLNWQAARDKCRGYGLVLVRIDNQAENDFLVARLGGADRWIGANDRNSNGNNDCFFNSEEGQWYWTKNTNSTTSDDNGTKFCTASGSGCTAVTGFYENWHSGDPDNSGCTCHFNQCPDGEDCGSIRVDGTWDDDVCTGTLGYICETP